MTTAFTIRPARLEDGAAICRTHLAAIRETAASYFSPEQIEAWAAYIYPNSYEQAIQEQLLLVAEDDAGMVVGFAQFSLENATVKAVYVHPAYGRRGVGTALLKRGVEAARSAGVRCLYVEAARNAVPFYERAGFVALRETQHRLNGTDTLLPCVEMVKDLTDDLDQE